MQNKQTQIIDGIKVSIKYTHPTDEQERKKRVQEILSKVAARQNVKTKN